MTVPGQVASYIEAQELYTTNYLQLFAFNYYGIKNLGILENEIPSSLHLSEFKWTLFSRDHPITQSAILWAWLSPSFGTVSEAVVSSTYFHNGYVIYRSFIISTNYHVPNLVLCSTPEGTDPHSEKHSTASLILCDISERKSTIQLVILAGNLHLVRNFLIMIDKIKSLSIIK